MSHVLLVSTQMPMALTIPECTNPTSRRQHCDFACWLVLAISPFCLPQENCKFWVMNCRPLPPSPAALKHWLLGMMDRDPSSLRPGEQLLPAKACTFHQLPEFLSRTELHLPIVVTYSIMYSLLASFPSLWYFLESPPRSFLLHLNPCCRACSWGDSTKTATC